jgi:transglutaminase-like putative cysteine protease
MVLTLKIHRCRSADLVIPDEIHLDPFVSMSHDLDSFGNWCTRFVAPPCDLHIWSDALVEDSGAPDLVARGTPQTPVEDLPPEALLYLAGSRYCETDLLSPVAWELFGCTRPGWDRVEAICDFVHDHVQFGYGFARSTKTACDTYRERAGVCRDFAHLAIALCRSMNIPARYCTGYLGDIGVPASAAPMDFSGWFEAFVGGRWFTFDARHNVPRIGRIVIARGRDAADVAISTAFGPSVLKRFRVWTDEIPDKRDPPVARLPAPPPAYAVEAT